LDVEPLKRMDSRLLSQGEAHVDTRHLQAKEESDPVQPLISDF
jgi:hypothetical protein